MSARQIFDHEKSKEFVTPMGKIKNFVIPLEKYSGLLETNYRSDMQLTLRGFKTNPFWLMVLHRSATAAQSENSSKISRVY